MTWVKIDVETPTDGKLLGQPASTRLLWFDMLCLAKKREELGDPRGTLIGYDCALLGGLFNIPRKAVAAALTYFQQARMVELDPDGTIRLLNYVKHQGDRGLLEVREQARQRKEKQRGVTRDQPDTSRVTSQHRSRVIPLAEGEGELEGEGEGELEKQEQKQKHSPAPKKGAGEPAKTAATWEAFTAAYLQRWKVAPTRNKVTNSQMLAFVERIGITEAPEVAAFFVHHPSAYFARKGHQVGDLLANAEGIRTQWKSGKIVTAHGAALQERSQENFGSWSKLLKGEETNGGVDDEGERRGGEDPRGGVRGDADQLQRVGPEADREPVAELPVQAGAQGARAVRR